MNTIFKYIDVYYWVTRQGASDENKRPWRSPSGSFSRSNVKKRHKLPPRVIFQTVLYW